jgi:hypothetical protein
LLQRFLKDILTDIGLNLKLVFEFHYLRGHVFVDVEDEVDHEVFSIKHKHIENMCALTKTQIARKKCHQWARKYNL